MRTTTHTGALLLAFAGSLMAAAQEPDLLALPGKPAPAFRLQDALIEKAVRETIAESREQDKGKRNGKGKAALSGSVLSGDKYQEFGRQFSEAQKPSCLGPDPMKHQPTGFTYKGWNFGAAGPLLLPFWGAAILRGKCN